MISLVFRIFHDVPLYFLIYLYQVTVIDSMVIEVVPFLTGNRPEHSQRQVLRQIGTDGGQQKLRWRRFQGIAAGTQGLRHGTVEEKRTPNLFHK